MFLTVDVLAVAIVARLAVFFRGKPVAYQLLLGALTCLLGAHISRTAAYLTDMVPAPFGSQSLMLLGFGLIAAASLHPSMRRATRMGRARSVPVGRGHLGLLSLTILLGPAIVIWRYVERGSWVIVAAAGPALVSLLVVMHLSRMIRERQRLEFATNHDPLTGLVNRTCFHDRVTLALGRGDGQAPPYCSSTSTASRTSTTPSVTTPATSCSAWSRIGSRRAPAPATRSRASAATSSPSSCPARRTPARRPAWPSGCSRSSTARSGSPAARCS